MTDMRIVILYRKALIDAMVMLEAIEKNKNMPPFAQTTSQYIALGKQIRLLLEKTKEGAACKHYCGAAECYVDWDEFHCQFDTKSRGKGSI